MLHAACLVLADLCSPACLMLMVAMATSFILGLQPMHVFMHGHIVIGSWQADCGRRSLGAQI